MVFIIVDVSVMVVARIVAVDVSWSVFIVMRIVVVNVSFPVMVRFMLVSVSVMFVVMVSVVNWLEVWIVVVCMSVAIHVLNYTGIMVILLH